MKVSNVIGVDLGATNITAGRIEFEQLVNVHKQNITINGSEEDVVQDIINSIKSVLSKDTAAIGIGVPGLVDLQEGIVFDLQNIPSWKKVHLKQRLETEFNLPVFINNDANCFTIGEKIFGKGKPYSNLIGITLGSGLGGGIIIDNSLYNGVNCGAGEFGSLPYLDGIVEHYCSGQFFKKYSNLSGQELFQKAGESDPQALKLFRKFGRHLGQAVISILFTFDPEAIIFGGSVSASFEFFQDSMWEVINTFPYKHSTDKIYIGQTTQPDIAVLGAAALCYEQKI